VIVVDGASKDDTVAAAQPFKRNLPKLTILSVEHPNISKQRNAGARIAKGSWFLFIDADSILLPYAVERVDSFIRAKNPGLFTSWFRSDTESPSDALVTLLFNMYIEAALLLHRPVTQGTFMVVERSAFRSVQGFDEQYLFGEDYDLTKRLIKKDTKLHILREVLYVYSFRRLRYQKTLKVLQSYARSVFSVLLTNKTPRSLPGYIMGGAPYNAKKVRRQSARIQFNKKFRAFMREVFE
jgi:glycosyltransferase involved in cell wall biosynthesis